MIHHHPKLTSARAYELRDPTTARVLSCPIEALSFRDDYFPKPSSQVDFAKMKVGAAVNPFAILFYPINDSAAGEVTPDRHGIRRQ